jgi:tRNA A37 N6-isopentenylltransferase MiaA
MHAAEKWLKKANQDVKVEGILIGSRDPNSGNTEVELLEREIAKNLTDRSPERVMDIVEVLTQTEKAHQELLAINEKAQKAAS